MRYPFSCARVARQGHESLIRMCSPLALTVGLPNQCRPPVMRSDPEEARTADQSLQAIGGGEASMTGAGSIGGCGLGVSVDHHSGLPAGNQHQLVLIAALRQPAGGESMPELVRMHSRKPRGPGPVVHDLVDARGSHGSIAADPEVRQVRKSMLLAYPQIAVQGLSGLAAKRERPRSVTLAEHPHIRWSSSTSSTVMPTHSARRMPVSTSSRMMTVSRRLVKSRPSQVLRRRTSCSARMTPTGRSGRLGGFMPSMGLAWRSPSATAHLKKAWRLR